MLFALTRNSKEPLRLFIGGRSPQTPCVGFASESAIFPPATWQRAFPFIPSERAVFVSGWLSVTCKSTCGYIPSSETISASQSGAYKNGMYSLILGFRAGGRAAAHSGARRLTGGHRRHHRLSLQQFLGTTASHNAARRLRATLRLSSSGRLSAATPVAGGVGRTWADQTHKKPPGGGFRERGSSRRTNGKHQSQGLVGLPPSAEPGASGPSQIPFYR